MTWPRAHPLTPHTQPSALERRGAGRVSLLACPDAGVLGRCRRLADLRAPDGVYFVTGNHEYLHGATGLDWMRWMNETGLTVLNNDAVTLPGAGENSTRWDGCAGSFDLL